MAWCGVCVVFDAFEGLGECGCFALGESRGEVVVDAGDVHVGGLPGAFESFFGQGDAGRTAIVRVGISLHESLAFEPVDERGEPGGAQACVLGHVLHADAARPLEVGVNEGVVGGEVHVGVVAQVVVHQRHDGPVGLVERSPRTPLRTDAGAARFGEGWPLTWIDRSAQLIIVRFRTIRYRIVHESNAT